MDQRIPFQIQFQSLQLSEFDSSYIGRVCLLRFSRNANDIKTKESTLDDSGFAEFNEKIEMKTQIDFNKSTGRYEPKLATLTAELASGEVLGSVQIDLTHYAKPDHYSKQLTMDNLASGVGPKSFINMEVKTQVGSRASAAQSASYAKHLSKPTMQLDA